MLSHIFTDGSASPPDLPQIRLSSWGLVWSCTHLGSPQGRLHGITPGPFHTIARADTYAVLQAIRLHARVALYVGVVNNLRRIIREGYQPMNWRAVPNNDIWLPISQCIATRHPFSISVTKVKSHLTVGPHMTAHEQWLTKGNDAADEAAKEALNLFTVPKFHANPRWKPMIERRMVEEARLATACLHDISQHLLSLRKNGPEEEDTRLPTGPDYKLTPWHVHSYPFISRPLFPRQSGTPSGCN